MTFPDLLERLGLPSWPAGTHHHVREGWHGFDCPWCSPRSSSVRMGYKESGGYVSCWVCGRKNLVETLAEASGRGWAEVKKLIAGLDRPKWDEAEVKPAGRLTLPKGIGPLLKPHRRYLRGRGFVPKQLEATWGLGGIGLAARLQWRLFIPIRDRRGAAVSWTTRGIGDADGAKYVGAKPSEEAVPAKSLLYGEEHARSGVVIVEGPADAWRIGPGAVATLGLNYTRAQLLRMAEYPVRAVCFDAEPEAQRTARKLCSELEAFPGATSRIELDSDDPGAASDRDVELIKREFLR